MSKRLIVLFSLFALSGGLVAYDRLLAPSTSVVAAVHRPSSSSEVPVSSGQPLAGTAAEKPMPVSNTQARHNRRLASISASDTLVDPFGARHWAPPPIPVAPPASSAASAPLAPAPPPLPFVYVGKQRSGAAWEVFLARGEQTVIVKEGSSIDNDTYRVDAIRPPLLTLTYAPMSLVQTIDIGADE